MALEEQIIQEIKEWSAHALEKPSEYFAGMPPCPYAKRAWADNKVTISFKYDGHMQDLYSAISQFEDEFDLHIIVDLAFEEDPEEFQDYLYQINEAISDGLFIDKDIWLMGFHPHDEPNDLIDDQTFTPLVEVEYAMIFVQRLSKVQRAADKLKEKGYYDKYLDEYDAEHLFIQRRDLYERLMENSNGNETKEDDARRPS
jgi:hypothetical protein